MSEEIDSDEADRHAEALTKIREDVAKAHRSSVAFPSTFACSRSSDSPPPLLRLISGEDGAPGQGGFVRLALYLCLTMMATKAPHDVERNISTNAWARRLALPAATGGRRIAYNLTWLAEHRFISMEKRTGASPRIVLLDAAGGGGKYVRPMSRFIRMPPEFWTQGWLLDLSPVGTALLFVLRDLRGVVARGDPERFVSVTGPRRERYGLSPDSWTRGTRELVSHGLLAKERDLASEDDDIAGYTRNRFRLIDDGLLRPSRPSTHPRTRD